ncbi:hypothetical protein [Blastococcus brunescens]|uniref:RecC C-terminal domain-containing protein n=1 Tax=Blastococcus brunescens TaxID=1564165 RepID=A0ABZ1B7Y1_9ACTN|nr:hypothetical protein [Blastococcus sp. BMG 8361]WRL66854.1 hypothetical protein U6N30_04840 [Blastococcus sp. BMG 8361]
MSFWQHPAEEFLAQRLDVGVNSADEEPDDAMPVEPGPLELWAVGDRVLRSRLRGVGAAEVRELERARGALPPPPLGDRQLAAIGTRVDRLVDVSAPLRTGPAQTLAVDAALAGGLRVLGAVGGVHGDVLLTVTYSRVRPKQRLRAWVELLALTATRHDRPWRAVVVGRGDDDPDVTVVTLGPVGAEDARAALADLVRLRAHGCCGPLPVPVGTGAGYAEARSRGRDPGSARVAAESAWASSYRRDGEDVDAAHALIWGEAASLTVLEDWTASPGLLGDAHRDEPTDFGRLARTIWQPLLDAERTVVR